MKIGANLMINCPVCKSLMIISNPLKQDKMRAEHKIVQQCGDCKRVIIVHLEIAVKMWEVKESK